MSWLRGTRQILLHVEDTPHRIALAFGIGVWIAFFPIIGIHTGMALGIAFAFRLSRAVTVLGCYLNNPWTLVPLYTFGTGLGCWILGVPIEGLGEARGAFAHHSFGRAVIHALRPFLWPYVIGNSILGVLAGLAAYVVLRAVLERRRRSG
jgi:uncharacterized protein